MTPQQAEDYVYSSYLKAAAHYDYETADSRRRFPEYTAPLIRRLAPDCDTVVITGSKGKGSVAVMTEAILRSARRHTGMLTSPHVLDFCERFCVDGRMVSHEAFAAHTHRVACMLDPIADAFPPDRCISPMGVQALVAMSIFAEAGVERMVLECGKGARYDDVNNVPHRLAVINPVFAEHTRELGATPELIADDKSHVITDAVKMAFVARQSCEVMEVIERRARLKKCELKVFGRDFGCYNVSVSVHGTVADIRVGDVTIPRVRIPLIGSHQAENCAMAFAVALEMLGGECDFEAARHNLAVVRRPGRLEIVAGNPLVVLDACINWASCSPVLAALREIGVKRCATVIGIPDDKDFLGVAAAMAPVSGLMVLTRSSNPHYRFTLPWQRQQLAETGICADIAPEVTCAVADAARSGMPVVVLGTTSVITEMSRRD